MATSQIDETVFLKELFFAAVKAAEPNAVLASALPQDRSRPAIVIGAGKASAQMARAFEQAWSGPVSGAVVTSYGSGVECQQVKVLEASHPIPDANGLKAAESLKSIAERAGQDDLVVALISGGGSALLPLPAEGLTLEDEIAVNVALLRSGAPISAMNAVRKQVSLSKGGRLALAAYPAEVITLIISDVPGDHPAQVASGPTVPDASTAEDALNLVDLYRINLPERVVALLKSASCAAPTPDHAALEGNAVKVIASSGISLEAAARVAMSNGIAPAILSDSIEGEARDVGRVLAAMAREVRVNGRPFGKPSVLLSGGETTVTLKGKGKGGRNTEFLLSFALAIEGIKGIYALAADTDGIDGNSPFAGAIASGKTAGQIRSAGYDPAILLFRNNSLEAFEAAGSAIRTGPTGTNVNDFRAILIR